MTKTYKRFVRAMAVTVASAGLTSAVYAADAARRAEGGVPAGLSSPDASISITNCKLTNADWINNDTLSLSTTSTTFVAVPGMTKAVTTAGTGCVIVRVSGFSFAATASNELEIVGVTLDGVLGNPNEVQFSGDDDQDADGAWAREEAAVFAFANVPAGPHSVAMVFRSFFGGSVTMHRPAMRIAHN